MGGARTPPRNKGSFAKGGGPNPAGRTLKAGTGGKAYRDRERDLKTNERSVAANMPLLSEFPNYVDCGGRRRKMGNDVAQPSNKHGGRLLR